METLNLTKLNLTELHTQEMKETQGGCWNCTPFPALGRALGSILLLYGSTRAEHGSW